MDKRKHKRFATLLRVKINSGSLHSWGILHDVSEKGVFIKGSKDFSIGDAIAVEIFMPDKSGCLLNGIVRRRVALQESYRKHGLGIELTEWDARYTHYIKSVITAHSKETESR
jgi:hypothetical protein